jgi:cell division protein FtsW
MLRAGQMLQLAVIALLGLAVVMVHSAGMSISDATTGAPGSASGGGFLGGFDPWAIVTSRPAIYALASVLAMLLASRLDLRRITSARHWSVNPVLWLTAAALLLVGLTFVPQLAVTINGARRWLRLGPAGSGLTFQPSEIVKWVMVIALACWCASQERFIARFWRGLVPALALVAVACGLIVIEDLGTAVLVGLVACCVLIAGGARIWQMAMLVPPAGGAVYAAIIHSPYRMARLTSFLDPWQDPQGTGYQAIQSMLAIAGGGPTGRGIGNGIQKFDYLPSDTTDFVFGIICEEMGLAGAALVIALFLVIVWVGLSIVRDCRDTLGRLVGLGVLVTVGLQALINTAVVTVMLPTKGIALPLLSSGGTGWVLTAFALGLVASLDEANRLDALSEVAPHSNADADEADDDEDDADADEVEGILDEPSPALSVSATQFAEA